MAYSSQKVVTSGIAFNTISRKWRPTSVSQPSKTFDGSTSASVSLRSVEASSKSPFEDQFPNLIDTVRNSCVEQSETLLLLSVAMNEVSIRSQNQSAGLCLVSQTRSKPDGISFTQKGCNSASHIRK